MHWSTLVALAAVTTAPVAQVPTETPAARVERNVVDRPGRPEIRVTVPAGAKYLGADRFVLKELSDCEMHIFVEADADRRVRRFYWVHFESNLPTRPDDRMHYGDTDHRSRIWGKTVWTSFEPARMTRVPRPGSDTEHFRAIISNAGYSMPAGMMTARLVRLLDDPHDTGFGRREVMMLYGEDLAASGLTFDDVTTDGKPNSRWAALEQPLLRRASHAFRMSEH